MLSLCTYTLIESQDLTDLLRALERLNRVEARIILAGDFNRADERCPGGWKSFLDAAHVFDVFPSLVILEDYLLWTDALFPMTGQFCEVESCFKCN